MKILLTSIMIFSTGVLFAQNSAYGWYFEGNKQLFRKNYEAAVKAYDKAIEMDENADYAYYNRGNARFEQKQYMEARLDYNKTILINPEYAEAYYGRGRCKIFLGDKEGGCKDLQEAKKMEFTPAKEEIEIYCKK